MSEAVIIVTVKLKAGASRERFLELGREVKAWLERQPGFVQLRAVRGRRRPLDRRDDVGERRDDGGSVTKLSARAISPTASTTSIEPEHMSFIGQAVAL